MTVNNVTLLLLLWMLSNQIEYFYFSIVTTDSQICLYTVFYLNNLFAIHIWTMVVL